MSGASTSAGSIYRTDLFSGKTCIVTGGGTGIGFAVARELLSLGAEVFICGRKQDKLDEAATALGGRVHAMLCNIRKEEDVQAFVEHVVAKTGRIDCLVNNAGGQFVSPAEMISARGFNAVVQTNLIGLFLDLPCLV